MSVMRWFLLGGVAVAMGACRGERNEPSDAATGNANAPADSVVSAIPDAPVGDSGARKLLPVDEADSSFTEFRRQLLVTLQQRDTAQLYAIIAPEIKASFGGDGGVAGFKRIWKMDNPDSSAVWTALTRALTLGGKKQGRAFVVPYVFAAWPNDVDAFQHVAITGEKVPAYSQPDATSPVAAVLTHSILPVEKWQGLGEDGVAGPGSFAQVKLPDGRSLWVNGTQVYSPVSWRAFFEKRNGKWLMTLFVAGD